MTAVVVAWQAALAAEHRAVFGYGLLGPHLTGAQQVLAVTSSDAHEQLRNQTAAALTRAGVTPVAAAVDYPDLYPVTDAASARRAAVGLEDGCAAAWRYLYLQAAGETPDPVARTAAQQGLTASAVRAAQWRVLSTPAAATDPFPGID